MTGVLQLLEGVVKQGGILPTIGKQLSHKSLHFLQLFLHLGTEVFRSSEELLLEQRYGEEGEETISMGRREKELLGMWRREKELLGMGRREKGL